jgi:replicative DNA helicase
MSTKTERLFISRAISGSIRDKNFFNNLVASGVSKGVIGDEIASQIFDQISSCYENSNLQKLDFDVIHARCADASRENAKDFAGLVSLSCIEEIIKDAKDQKFDITKECAEDVGRELKSIHVNKKISNALKDASDTAATSRLGVSMALKTLGDLQSKISREMGFKSKTTTIKEMKQKILSDITTEEDPPISTGFPQIDDALFGGFQKSYLVYVCGRPGMAKTQVLINMMIRAAEAGRKCLFMTYELPSPFIVKRILAYKSNMTLSQLIGGTRSKEKITQEDIDMLMETIDRMSDNIFVCDASGMNIAESAAYVRSEIESKGIQVAYFDYVQIIRTPDGRVPDKESDFASISFVLRELAASGGIPVVSAAQLNREVEKRKNKRPALSDLRSSGSLENDARVVIGLYRDEYYNKHTDDQNILEMSLLKNTNGGLITTRNFFDKQKCKILELDENREEPYKESWDNLGQEPNQEVKNGSLFESEETGSSF